MFSCAVCGDILPSVIVLSDHLKFAHGSELGAANNQINCGQDGCPRAFNNLKQLRKHLQDECTYPAAVKSCEVMDTSTCFIDNALSEFESEQADEITYSENTDEDAKECLFDLFDKLNLDANVTDDSEYSTLKDSALKFIGKFYANPDLSRAIVQTIIESTSDLISKCVSFVLKDIDKMQEEKEVSMKAHSSLHKTLAIVSHPFNGLETEFQRFSCLLKRGVFLKPESFVCGRKGTNKVTGQFISLKQTLQRFFELPNVLSSVQSYVKFLEEEKKHGILSNFIQGELWQSKCKNFVGKFVLPLFLHFDEIELGNPLGPHNNIHKLGAMNAKCPCLPPEFVSLIENHFLVLLFHASDRYADNPLLEVSNNKIMFNKIIEEINDLRLNGIRIETENGNYQLYFDIGLILGDNLGLHSILGLAESFVANYPCLYCKMSKEDCRMTCKENVGLLRNCDNYEEDLAVNDVSLTGLKEDCVFHQIEGFHVTNNYTVDFMHDVLEGICDYDLVEILYNFVYVEKYFSLDVLNSAIFTHDYGNVSNKPPLVSENDLKSGSIRMSANEMLTFVQHLPVLIGQYVPNDNQFWKLLLLLYDIVLILMSSKLQLETVSYLNYLIIQHHTLYVLLLGDSLKPKHHHLLHYVRMILESGPPIHYWSMRFESQHRVLKRYSNVCFSRVNISYSVALKQELAFAYRCVKGGLRKGLNLVVVL